MSVDYAIVFFKKQPEKKNPVFVIQQIVVACGSPAARGMCLVMHRQ